MPEPPAPASATSVASAPGSLEDQGKALLKSKTMLGLLVTLLGTVMPAILAATHVKGVSSSDAVDLIQQGLTFGGMAYAAYGRIVAKQKIA